MKREKEEVKKEWEGRERERERNGKKRKVAEMVFAAKAVTLLTPPLSAFPASLFSLLPSPLFPPFLSLARGTANQKKRLY